LDSELDLSAHDPGGGCRALPAAADVEERPGDVASPAERVRNAQVGPEPDTPAVIAPRSSPASSTRQRRVQAQRGRLQIVVRVSAVVSV